MRESKLWLIQEMFPLEDKENASSLTMNASKMKKFIASRSRFEMNKLTSDLQNLS